MFDLFPWDVSATLQKPVCLIPTQKPAFTRMDGGLMLRLQIQGGATTVGLPRAPSLLTSAVPPRAFLFSSLVLHRCCPKKKPTR